MRESAVLPKHDRHQGFASPELAAFYGEGVTSVGDGERDPEAVAEAAMAFDVIETQMRRYVARLGGQLPTVDAAAED